MNNIFKFATGELSQDAFICWFFNWFNEGDNPKLRQLVIDFCNDKLGISNLSSIDIHRQFSKKVEKENTAFSVKIDVLVILNKEIAVIVEDKTFTSEHSNQILRYEEGLRILQERDLGKKLRIEDKVYSISKILTVYWKTGFFYDYDKCVKVDKIVDSDYLIELLDKYRDEDEIINMYVQKLVEDKQWYDTHSKYWERTDERYAECIENTNLYRHQIAQYKMMREIFPADEMWKGGDLYYVYHGSSYGRPWTEMSLYCNRKREDTEGDERFEIFLRIDSDSKGSYISLRLYKDKKGRWDSKYEEIKKCARNVIDKDCLYQWNDIDPGRRDYYKEADIAHFIINREKWEKDGEHLKEVIRVLTSDVIRFAEEKYGHNVYK